MKEHLGPTVWRVAIFLVLCCVGIFAIVAIFGQLRFQSEKAFNAVFSSVSGLKTGNFVRIAGVEVGKVKSIRVQPDTTVDVQFTVDDSVVLTEGTRALVRYENLVGDRYMALEEGAGGVRALTAGQSIPLGRTQPALDLDALIGGFRPLFRALNPDQVNALTGQLIEAFQGQAEVVGSVLTQTASLTKTLANRDQLIGEVITNLNTLLGTLADQSKQFDGAVDSLAQLVHGLAERKTDVTNSVAYLNAAAGSVADLLTQARPPAKDTVHQLDRAAGLAVADHDYLDNLLNTLPDKYQLLARQGLYGDYFSFYLCDITLKLNGKGGQPVYVKIAGQDTGRCAPK
jgi:phospholipid/cholesterol/gamma-HCH transport system substrate-binding protein